MFICWRKCQYAPSSSESFNFLIIYGVVVDKVCDEVFGHHKHCCWLCRTDTYLFMEAEELAVTDPAVQHAVNVDVVGLRREGKKDGLKQKK